MPRHLERPPVKAACLACRAAKARCNGQNPCSRCHTNNRTCVYQASRRGRVARAPASPASVNRLSSTLRSTANRVEHAPQIVTPDTTTSTRPSVLHSGSNRSTPEFDPTCLPYESDVDIINVYYLYIHPAFPLLPPPDFPVAPRLNQGAGISNYNNHVPTSPLTLALATILVHINSHGAREERHKYSRDLCQRTLEAIEYDLDCTELSARTCVYPGIPAHLEKVLAALLIAVYEYCYRGSVVRARIRTASAIALAMDANLHAAEIDQDSISECQRRIWWMSVFFANQVSIIHHIPPLINLDDPRIKRPFPSVHGVKDVWPMITSAQHILLTSQGPTTLGPRENEKLASTISSFIEQLDRSIPLPLASNMESLVTQNWWAIARIIAHSAYIKLHRNTAFADIPAFLNTHCDMAGLLDTPAFPHFPLPHVDCHQLNTQVEHQTITPSFSTETGTDITGLPCAQESADICLESAFVVLRMCRYLTEVLTRQQRQAGSADWQTSGDFEYRFSQSSVPITVPLIACSTMQACYVMVMMLYRFKFTPTPTAAHTSEDQITELHAEDDVNPRDTERQIEELRHGMEDSLQMLKKYHGEFAHIPPMYEELASVHRVAFAGL